MPAEAATLGGPAGGRQGGGGTPVKAAVPPSLPRGGHPGRDGHGETSDTTATMGCGLGTIYPTITRRGTLAMQQTSGMKVMAGCERVTSDTTAVRRGRDDGLGVSYWGRQ